MHGEWDIASSSADRRAAQIASLLYVKSVPEKRCDQGEARPGPMLLGSSSSAQMGFLD